MKGTAAGQEPVSTEQLLGSEASSHYVCQDPSYPTDPVVSPPDSSYVFGRTPVITTCPECQVVGPTVIKRVMKPTNSGGNDGSSNCCLCSCGDCKCDGDGVLCLLLVLLVFCGLVLLVIGAVMCCRYMCCPGFQHVCPHCKAVIGRSYK